MSGIAGIFAYHYAANDVDRAEFVRICGYLSQRGNDASGTWCSENERLILGRRQLVPSEFSSQQPAISTDGKTILVFDGEIYNSRQLYEGLDPEYRSFPSTSVAELLLQLYVQEGELFIKRLRGMFAFAIWDSQRGAMLLGRDPFGTKPLYYADNGWTLRFASRVKALLAGGKLSTVQEPAALAAFYLSGIVPDPLTTYQEIRSVPPGSILVVDRIGAREPKPVFPFQNRLGAGGADRPPSMQSARQTILDRVRRQVTERVGVIVAGEQKSPDLLRLLSGIEGIEVRTLSLSFEGQHSREDRAATTTNLSVKYSTHHSTRHISEEEFREELPKIVHAMDQPSLRGITTWFLCKAAKELGLEILLSGLNVDGCFRAKKFRPPSLWERPRNTVRGCLSNVSRSSFRTPEGKVEPAATLLRDDLPHQQLFTRDELKSLLGENPARIGLRRLARETRITSRLQFQSHDFNDLLRVNDWVSSAHAVRIRVPLLDSDLQCCSALAQHVAGSECYLGPESVPVQTGALSESARRWALRVAQHKATA